MSFISGYYHFPGYLNVQYKFEDVLHQNTFMRKVVRERKKRGRKKEGENEDSGGDVDDYND